MTEKEKLSPVLEKYLLILYQEELKDSTVKASIVADKANVTRATVTRALKTLFELGYINYAPYSSISLTEKGLRYALDIAHRGFVFEEFLINILHCDPLEAKENSRLLSADISPAVFNRLRHFTLFMHTKKSFWMDWEREASEISSNHRRKFTKNTKQSSSSEMNSNTTKPKKNPTKVKTSKKATG